PMPLWQRSQVQEMLYLMLGSVHYHGSDSTKTYATEHEHPAKTTSPPKKLLIRQMPNEELQRSNQFFS
ncbi:MAG: hypothetical protein PF495_20110, partial [Spirochaetales bacterium]|nr:hypothetical protein [Spirochaetales bacterium]